MARDLEKEQQKIKNGNRYIIDDSGTGVFARDCDRLFLEYTNLRKKLYNKHKDAFSDQAMQLELASYIDEQFIKLVKEYEINAPVDFPGYIKKKLTLRVEKAFMKSKFKDMDRERIPHKDNDILDLLEVQPDYAEGYAEDRELLEHVFEDGSQFTAVELDIIRMLLSLKYSDNKIIQTLSKKHGLEAREIGNIMAEVQDYVRFKVNDYNKPDSKR